MILNRTTECGFIFRLMPLLAFIFKWYNISLITNQMFTYANEDRHRYFTIVTSNFLSSDYSIAHISHSFKRIMNIYSILSRIIVIFQYKNTMRLSLSTESRVIMCNDLSSPPFINKSSVNLTETPPYQALHDEAVFNIVLATIAIEICFMHEF